MTLTTSGTYRWRNLRTVVLRHDDQLHRPAGARHSCTTASERPELERLAIRVDRDLLPGCLCYWLSFHGKSHGQDRQPDGIYDLNCFLEPGNNASCNRPDGNGIRLCPFCVRTGRIRKFPAAIKASTEWFPLKERSFANGNFCFGCERRSIVAPLMVPFIAINYGWQWTFIITGLMGFIWLFSGASRIVLRRIIPPKQGASWHIFKVTRRTLLLKFHGSSCSPINRRGHLRSGNFLRTLCSHFSFSFFRNSFTPCMA